MTEHDGRRPDMDKERRNVPILHVQMLEGRSTHQKQALLRELTAAMVRCLEVEPERVTVQISEFAEGTWSRGGVPLTAARTDLEQ